MKNIFYFICIAILIGACVKESDTSHLSSPLEQRAAVFDTFIKPFNESWLYFASNKEPTGKWTQLNYNDSIWPDGKAELGYGDGDEVTVVPRSYLFSRNANMTTYFRKKIFLSAAQVTNLLQFFVNVHRDDGAVVYVNGVEKIRSNMPSGIIKYSTPALDTMEGAAVGPRSENVSYNTTIQAFGLKAGWNIIAAEIHQFSVREKDMSFGLTIYTMRSTN